MENRDRDKMSHNTNGTAAGDVNRETSAREGKHESGSKADFGQTIGRSEGALNEPSKRPGSTGTGATGSTGMGKGSNHQLDEADRSGNSEGRH